MRVIDINCDLGESFGNWRMGNDDAMIPQITTANIACGFHAGDPLVMRRTVELACNNGVVVGAHPGLPDLLGFGRRRIEVTPDELYAATLYQVGALSSFLSVQRIELHHVKVHGALYHLLREQESLAEAAVAALKDTMPCPVTYWPAPIEKSLFARMARDAGIRVIGELYVDLDYDQKGQLIIERSKVRRRIDAVRARVSHFLSTGTVLASTGEAIAADIESICVHGDSPDALAIVEAVREALSAAGVAIAAAGGHEHRHGGSHTA